MAAGRHLRTCNNRDTSVGVEWSWGVLSNDWYGHKNNLCHRHRWHTECSQLAVQHAHQSDRVIQVVAIAGPGQYVYLVFVLECARLYSVHQLLTYIKHFASFHYETILFPERNTLHSY